VPERTSRVAEARRRAANSKQAAAALAAAGFLAIALLARGSHPAHASSATSPSTGSPSVATQDDNGFGLQSGQLGQSSGSSSGAQTGVS
jgi:hypothetical protein